MGDSGGLVVNGKFLSGKRTGVFRVADRLLASLSGHDEELRALFGRPARIMAPRNVDSSAQYGSFELTRTSVLTGQVWEQVELPARLGRELLLSFCNLAPVAHANAVTMIHDAQPFSSPGSYSPAYGRFYRTIQPLIGRRHRRILTVSAYSARQLGKYRVAPPDKIRVVHNGVDHIDAVIAEPGILSSLGLVERGYVLALASTQTHKNIKLLLEAFEAPALDGLKLVLFGATNRDEMRGAGFEGLDRVVFTGRVTDGEIRALMEGASCFATPSLTEGFGLPPLEAMLLGCPAVCAPCGALPEACGDAALYADATRPNAWIEAILALSGDRNLRRARIADGRAHAARFTWTHAAEQVMVVLRELAGEDQHG